MQRKWGAALIAVFAIIALSGLSFTAAYRYHLFIFTQYVENSSAIIASSIQDRYAGYVSLADMLSRDSRVMFALEEAGNASTITEMSEHLGRASFNAGAEQVMVIDEEGNTVASSGWVGLPEIPEVNVSFRPYFSQAMQAGRGSFNALALATMKPASFVSARVETPLGVKGVVAVQFAPLPGNRSSLGPDTYIALADSSGVVLMSNREDWLFRPLQKLEPEALEYIAETHQFDRVGVGSREPLLVPDGEGGMIPQSQGGIVSSMQIIKEANVVLILAKSLSGARFAAYAVAGLVALFSVLVSGLVLIFVQHRQLVRIQRQQSVLLEQKVEERTRELAAEIEVRKRTEASLRDAEHDLVQAAKLAVLGQMSAALAHEVSQPVTALAATLTAAERRLSTGDATNAGELIARGQSLVVRIQHTIRHLRSFSKKEKGETKRVVLANAITAALELAESRMREIGATLDIRDIDQGIAVMGSPVRLEQVLINLVMNALDAVAGVSSRTVGVKLHADGDQAFVCVWDTGAGIPASIVERLSEPFFTTKSEGDSLGLGLSISQSILADYGGSMRFYAREGGGTVCEVRLPLAANVEVTEAAE